MSKSLVNIVAEMHEIETALIENQGELTEEFMQELVAFETNKYLLVEKVDSYQYILKQTEARAEYWKKRKEEINNIQKSFKALNNQLKFMLKQAMTTLKVDELRGSDYYFKLSKTRPTIEYDEKNIQDVYKTQVVSTELDKESIKNDLDMGIQIDGVTVTESKSIRAYVNKEKN